MRIIAGKFRGRRLKRPPSNRTRPTSDRLRETLFNVLSPRIEGVLFLDLCAGTGAVGIEALSRGAEHVTFVDQSRQMCALIEQNLQALSIENDVEIVLAEVSDYLRRLVKMEAEPFDVAFFDPPYQADYEEVLAYFGDHSSQLLAADAVLIAEHDKRKELSEEIGILKRYRKVKQGDSVLSFYQ